MRVTTLDLRAQYARIKTEVDAAVASVFERQHFILGPEVTAFEKELASYVGTPHAVGISSGTDALLVALMALGVGPGDEVITTPYSFFATVGAIVRLGAVPRFVDIDADTFHMRIDDLSAAMTSRTKAIIVVHLFGQAADIPDVGIPVVEDAAQSLGAEMGKQKVGTIGAIGCFSFFPSKNLGGCGDGGAITTKDAALAERIRRLRAHGAKEKYYHELVGGNFRLDELQAAVLRVKLRHLDRWIAERRGHAQAYRAGLRGVTLPAERHFHTYNQFVVRSSRRDDLRRHLDQAGIDSAVYYPLPLHLQTCFAHLGYAKGHFPVAEAASLESLALPIYPELPKAALDRVITAVGLFPDAT